MQVSVGEEFGEMRWTVAKVILEGKVLGCRWLLWWEFGRIGGVSGGWKAGKWWRRGTGFLGDPGGSIGRGKMAWKGAGLLEKKEEGFLKISEGMGEGSGAGIGLR